MYKLKINNVNKDISIKNCTYFFFDDINIKDFHPNNIKIDENSCKNIFIYYIAYVAINERFKIRKN